MKQADGASARVAESLAVRVLERVPALADALVRTIQEQNPGYRALAVVSHDDLWQSCHDNLTRVLQLIAQSPASGGMAESDGHFDAARATGRRRAEQRMPLDDVLRSFRLGGRLVWEALVEQAHSGNRVDTDGLLDVATRVWEVVDTISAQVAAAYHVAEGELLRADAQRMAALWEGLLHGRAADMAFAHEASRILGVPVFGPYAVVVADVGAGRLAAQLGQRLAARDIVSAWQERADSLVGLLALRHPTVSPVLSALRAALTVPAGVYLGDHRRFGQAHRRRRVLSPQHRPQPAAADAGHHRPQLRRSRLPRRAHARVARRRAAVRSRARLTSPLRTSCAGRTARAANVGTMTMVTHGAPWHTPEHPSPLTSPRSAADHRRPGARDRWTTSPTRRC